MQTTYTPVSYDVREVIAQQLAAKKSGKVFFFNEKNQLDDASGMIQELAEVPGSGTFIRLDSGTSIRIDRIITLFGIPGAAYDEYDRYGNACMECHGGYEFED